MMLFKAKQTAQREFEKKGVKFSSFNKYRVMQKLLIRCKQAVMLLLVRRQIQYME